MTKKRAQSQNEQSNHGQPPPAGLMNTIRNSQRQSGQAIPTTSGVGEQVGQATLAMTALPQETLQQHAAQIDQLFARLELQLTQAVEPILEAMLQQVLQTVQQQLEPVLAPVRASLQQQVDQVLRPARETLQQDVDEALLPVRKTMQQEMDKVLQPARETILQQVEAVVHSSLHHPFEEQASQKLAENSLQK